jgi:nucleolar GTP-binding protein
MKMSTATGDGIEEVTSTLIEMVKKAIEEKETVEENEIIDDY